MSEMKTAYVVRWQTSVMRAPSFWYFAKRTTAEETARGFHRPVIVSVEETIVPADFELEDEE